MSLGSVLVRAQSRFSNEMSLDMVNDLIAPMGHSPLVRRRRSQLIVSRVRWVAAAFAVLTPLWIAIDIYYLPAPLSYYLAGLRVGASVAFGGMALLFRNTERQSRAQMALAALLAVPVIFFLISVPMMTGYRFEGLQLALAAGYAFLPFVMVAGLAVFPITALEGAFLSTPLILAMIGVVFSGHELLPFNSYLGALWLLGLLAMVSTLAGMAQLHFMIALVNQASHDVLTKVYARRVGEELLDVHFANSARQDLPLAVAFVDLDHFKIVNDTFGHEEGDHTLLRAAEVIRQVLRRGDVVVRWGGEEFVLIMPNTNSAGADLAIGRLIAEGLGTRPDGTPQTASIGIAERQADGAETWADLVERADQRMYQAKKNGRNQCCGIPCEEKSEPDLVFSL